MTFVYIAGFSIILFAVYLVFYVMDDENFKDESDDLLEFVRQNGLSVNHIDGLWGVTDGASRMVGVVCITPHAAIRSAIDAYLLEQPNHG